MFNCTPSAALRENPSMIFAIMEHRAIREANALKDDVTKMTPEQINAWWLLCPAASEVRRIYFMEGNRG